MYYYDNTYHGKTYEKVEEKAHVALDQIFKEGRHPAKSVEILKIANIYPCTFSRHFKEGLKTLVLSHDPRAYAKLKECLRLDNRNQKLDVIFLKVFDYIYKNQGYFEAARVRSNLKVFELFFKDLRPIMLERWSAECDLDKHTLVKIYFAYTFDVACVYDYWVRYENYDRDKIDERVKELMELTNTACTRLNNERLLSLY